MVGVSTCEGSAINGHNGPPWICDHDAEEAWCPQFGQTGKHLTNRIDARCLSAPKERSSRCTVLLDEVASYLRRQGGCGCRATSWLV